MATARPRAAQPTPEDLLAAERLRTLWKSADPAKRGTQEDVARLWGDGGNQSLISQYLTGRIPLNYLAVVRFAQALGVDPREIRADLPEFSVAPWAGLTTGQPAVDSDTAGFVAVRRGTLRLSAGVLGYAIEYENHDAPPIFFREAWFRNNGFRPDRLLGLKVRGSSMEPGLHDGDTVIVNLQDTKPHDGTVFAVNYEGECVIKRLKRDAGEWWLSSDNQDKRRYPDKKCTEDAIIVGRVVHKASDVI